MIPLNENDPFIARLNSIEYTDETYDEDSNSKCPVNCHYIYPNQMSKNNRNDFSIISYNIRSMKANFESLKSEILGGEHKFDVIGLCEAKMTDVTEKLYMLPGYNFYASNVASNKGGVCIYINNNYNCKMRSDLCMKLDYLETVFVDCTVGNKEVTIGMIYHRPGTSFEGFIVEINRICSKLNNHSVLMGDFNINILRSDTDTNAFNFIQNMKEFSFAPIITKPTRVHNNSASLLDHIWVNFTQAKGFYSYIILTDISDHFATTFCYDSLIGKPSLKRISYRKSGPNCDENFKLMIDQIDFDAIYEEIDVNEAFEKFHDLLFRCYNDSYPIVTKVIKDEVPNPWLTSAIKQSIRNKNKLYKKFLKRPITYGNEYRTYRNLLGKVVKKAKNDYYQLKFNESHGNIKQTWKNINHLLGKTHSNKNKIFNINGKKVDNESQIAHAFNEYYSNIGNITAENLSHSETNFEQYLPNKNYQEIIWNQTSAREVKDIILKCRLTKPGPDEIPMHIFKTNADTLSPVLSHLYNLSLTSGVFPRIHKLGKVFPLYKNKERDMISNYRPICLLNAVSKVLEKIVAKRIIRHLDQHNIISNDQYAYVKGKGTDTAAINYIKDILENFDNNKITISVYLDLTKAFDCVDHVILIKKLEYYGISHIALDWIRDYLSNRKQFVFYNNCKSSQKQVNIGVPQGSILGPILFLIYIHDLAGITTSGKQILFADDGTYYDSDKDYNCLIKRVNCDITKITEWFLANKLSINIIKTEAMVHSRKNMYFPLYPVIVQNEPICYSYHFKFLGLIIDWRLNWKKHIEYIKGKLASACGILHQIKNKINPSIGKIIYYSICYPYINYCNLLWASANLSTMQLLESTHKRIIRNLLNKNRYVHSSPLFKQLGLLKIHDINNLNALQFVFKTINGFTSSSITYVPRQIEPYELRREPSIDVPFAPSNQTMRFIHIRGARVWNEIPLDIRNSRTIRTFKNKVKKHYLNTY